MLDYPNLPDLKQIEEMREKLGISIIKLERNTGIKRSLISQIESGRSSTSYTNAVKLFKYLTSQVHHKNGTMEEICVKKVLSLLPTDTVLNARKIMIQKRFDCMPIIDRSGHLTGKITIFDIDRRKLGEQESKIQLEEIMDESPPTVPYDTPIDSLRSLLSFRDGDCVLLTKKGRTYGIVTPWDFVMK